MWTGSVTGTHADNQHGVAGQAGLARFTLLPRFVSREVGLYLAGAGYGAGRCPAS
jgi:hypothetical protein